MIANISDHKSILFLSIDKTLSNKIKFSLLKMVFSCVLNCISPCNDMLAKMLSLFAEYPEVDLCALGFPSGNWQDEPLWSTQL